MRQISCLVAIAVLAGCVHRSATLDPVPPVVQAPRISTDYIDLEAGWRLRVVTLLLKSGGYTLRPAAQQMIGNTVTIHAGDDFIGYETSYYDVRPRKKGGVRVEFDRAETTVDGQTSARERPVRRLFRIPGSMKCVRLIYLQRASHLDHDMAVVAARRIEDLDS